MKLKIIYRLVNMIPSKKVRQKICHYFYMKSDCEPELKNLKVILPEKKRTAIDAGANVGHYSMELSKYFHTVIAFEINEDLTSDFVTYNNNITLVNKGLSSKISEADLYIPMLNGNVPLLGWASLNLNNCPDTDLHKQKKVKITTLDFFGYKDIDFIKIDVEGHEYELLQGALNTIQSCRPTVLVEIKEGNLMLVRKFFKERNYTEASLETILGKHETENHLFIPL